MEKPWYILEHEEKVYLHGKKMQLKNIDFDSNDHRHCELCWDKFAHHNDCLQKGYYEEESQSWICEDCFNEFKGLFGWKDSKNRASSN